MEINDIVSGFKVLQKQYIKEAASTAYEFEHVKSGARLFFLANDDDNKVFSITFRTPPTDDTGVAHIVEHSTLCGSRKYPLKEPFVELVKGSLNTFLNAMTFPDKTMYPVASRNDKDFQNLMDVYLDAVFYPAMYEVPEVLMQEGWHYEIEKPDEPLRYSGVVYNEMKGALSSPDGLLESRLMAALYPSTTYSYESGGDPAAIPQLTQQMFKDFHKKYYHPSNSYIFLYGDMDIEAKLAYLDREYLAHFDRIPVPSKIDKQPLFDGLHRVAEEYPIGADEAAKEKTFLALGSIVGDADDAETLLALEILEQALLKNPAAPLRQALIDAKLGKDVDSIFEDALLQPMFAIILNGTEPEKADKFYQVVHDTLAGFVKNGLDRTLLEAAINPLEFKLREADFGQYPKGLIYNIKIMNSWLYGSDPAMFLYYEQLIQRMKDGLDSHYFEDVIRRCLLDNPHQVLMTMKPSTTLAAAKEKKLEDALAVKKASLQPDDIQHIIKTTAKLKQRQQSPETPEALASIPILKLSDIRREITPLVLEEREAAGAKVLFSNVNTNGIGYLMLYFNLRRVPQELIPYAYLLLDLLGSIDTKEHSYAELANLVNLSTGGIGYGVYSYANNGQPEQWQPLFRVKAKALVRKLPELFQLLPEILLDSKFTNKKRIQELLLQSRAGMEMDIMRAPQTLMASRLASYLTERGQFDEEGSLAYYWFVRELTEHFDERYADLSAKLAELLPMIFNREAVTVSYTAKEEDYSALADKMEGFMGRLSVQSFPTAAWQWHTEKKNEGLLSSSQVQYVGKAANFIKLGYRFTGSMRVLETLLRYDYFWTKIRVQGGAYGAMTRFDRAGMIFFGSYRDPNLSETLDVFDGTADYAAHFQASEREMDKFIIGTMSGIDTPLTPQMKGTVAANCWLQGVTDADRQQARDEILSTRQDDIQALAPLIAAAMQQEAFCVLGNEAKIKENKNIFGKLTPVME